MMQLGFNTAILPDADLEDVLETTSRLGYECVELACWPAGKAERRYAGVTHLDVTQTNDASLDRVSGLLAKHDVFISALAYYPNLLSPDAAEADASNRHMRLAIEMAAKLGVGQVNTFVGRDWTRSVDDNWPRFLDVWKPMIEFAESHQVRIGIENCPMLFTADEWPGGKNLAFCPANWIRMFNDIPSDHFGLNYDPSHLVWMQMDPITPIRDFADRIIHVHAKDVRVDQAKLNQLGILAHPNDYHSPKLPGLGEVDWGAFFAALTDIGYQGPVCVEVEDRAYEGSREGCERALIQCHTFLRNYIPRRSAS